MQKKLNKYYTKSAFLTKTKVKIKQFKITTREALKKFSK